MYALPDSRIVAHIRDYIQKCGGWSSEWYVGIATDVRQRLFGDHNVDEHRGYWIYGQASSEAVARQQRPLFCVMDTEEVREEESILAMCTHTGSPAIPGNR